MIRSYKHALGTGFFIFTSHFVAKKYFVNNNKFRLERSLIRFLGYIRTDVVFLQGSLLQRNNQNLLKQNYSTGT